jgi:hypothetical protein
MADARARDRLDLRAQRAGQCRPRVRRGAVCPVAPGTGVVPEKRRKVTLATRSPMALIVAQDLI